MTKEFIETHKTALIVLFVAVIGFGLFMGAYLRATYQFNTYYLPSLLESI